MTVSIVPVTKPPFECPEKPGFYYCSICKQYTSCFTPYKVKSRDRRCAPCLRNRHKRRVTCLTSIQRLQRKLSQNLTYHGRQDLASAVSVPIVVKILEENGIAIEDIDLVKTIRPSFNQSNKRWEFQPAFYKNKHNK